MAETQNVTFSHVGLTCENPVTVEEFYTRHFGFKRTKVFNPGPEQIVMIKSGNVYLELFKAKETSVLSPAQGTGPDYPGWRHICFAVDDVDAKLSDMAIAAKITLGPVNMDNLVAGMRVAWIADPEGNIVELNQGYVD